MFEQFREKWSKAMHPLIVRLGDTDPNTLTWTSLVVSLVAFWLVANAGIDGEGALMIVGAVILIGIAGVLDALDGDLARHQGTSGPYGDFLDHTIDRVVDIGLIVAIGFNSEFGVDLSLALGAALLTLMGSYMGTQAQSVGLGRIYGGFSRADRMVITVLGMILASLQAAGIFALTITITGDFGSFLVLGLEEMNGFGIAVVFSAWGGLYTFITRFISARGMLLGSVPES
ncbi:MAG: CDP-alcohol phosphatidyltransferase family protein [Candidatus Thermoplasmatota archaeon]|nr:CDP-alcohol phosphatidyltransferase family protein [Candidatus Thermoplasmatota archaeon]MED5267421.1 CDP-alcohol phosphatidyltransferase family protein [Candidatus Thermoplasmatota archaeon]